jgi:hypothetical protein
MGHLFFPNYRETIQLSLLLTFLPLLLLLTHIGLAWKASIHRHHGSAPTPPTLAKADVPEQGGGIKVLLPSRRAEVPRRQSTDGVTCCNINELRRSSCEAVRHDNDIARCDHLHEYVSEESTGL